MCTISLVPLKGFKNSFILTSNRDEATGRETLPPDFKKPNGVKLLFPQDKLAGGTWIGISEFKRVICLMNGGFEKHQRKENYRKSRGLVVTELLESENVLEAISEYDFTGIEPFTLILVDWQDHLQFYELVWDESKKHFKTLPIESHIWSSSPLYDKEVKTMREKWFNEHKLSKGLSAGSMLDFHQNAGTGDKENDLVIDRGFLKTQSISQVKTLDSKVDFWYKNLSTDEVTVKEWEL